MSMTSQDRDRGTCTACGRTYDITTRGTVRRHSRVIVTVGKVWTGRCIGGGKPPAAQEQP